MSEDLNQTSKRPSNRMSHSNHQVEEKRDLHRSHSRSSFHSESDEDEANHSINQSLIDTGSSTISTQSINTTQSQSIDAINQSINLLAVHSTGSSKRSMFAPVKIDHQSNHHSNNQTIDEHALVAADLLSFRDVINNRHQPLTQFNNQPKNQTIKQSNNRSTDEHEAKYNENRSNKPANYHSSPLKQQHGISFSQLINQPIKAESIEQANGQPAHQSNNQSNNQSIDQSYDESDHEDDLMCTGSSSLLSTGDSSGSLNQSGGQSNNHSMSIHSAANPLLNQSGGSASKQPLPRSKRRKLEEIPLRERWRCKNRSLNQACNQQYKRTSTTSIGVHIETCKFRSMNQSLTSSLNPANQAINQLGTQLLNSQAIQASNQTNSQTNNQSIGMNNQSINQSMIPISQSINQMNQMSVGQLMNQANNQTISQPMMTISPQMVMNGMIHQPISQPTYQTISQPINQGMIAQPVSQGDLQYYQTLQSINQSPNGIHQTINQPISQTMNGQEVKYVQYMAPMFQPVNQTISQPINQSMMMPQQLVFAQQQINQTNNQPIYQNGQMIYQPMPQYVQSIAQPIAQSINQSNNQSINQENPLLMSGGSQTSIGQSINQTMMPYSAVMAQTIANQAASQPINQIMNQPINQSIQSNQSLPMVGQYFCPTVVQGYTQKE